jgi:hypothetical protein
MAVFDLFSKKQKRLRGETPEVFTYDSIPQPLKVQVCQIIGDAVGIHTGRGENLPAQVFENVHRILCREYGVFTLSGNERNAAAAVFDFFLKTGDVDKSLDVIQLCFQFIDRYIRKKEGYDYYANFDSTPDEAIVELNARFKEHGVGYQFEGGETIRVDSSFMHSEVTKPTISLLWNDKFLGANEEYLKAHEHYRHGRNKECLTECLKAFESAMKIICKEKGWPYSTNDTSKKLIDICFSNNLVPNYLQSQFTALRSILESGIPTIRNRQGGHGQGQTPIQVDGEMTRYALNLTGSNIIFIVELSGIK